MRPHPSLRQVHVKRNEGKYLIEKEPDTGSFYSSSRKEEGASHLARRGKNAEVFLEMSIYHKPWYNNLAKSVRRLSQWEVSLGNYNYTVPAVRHNLYFIWN